MPDTFAQPGACDAVLVPSITTINERRDVKLAIFKLVTKDNWDQSKKAFSAALTDYFKGSYSDFDEKRNVSAR